MLLLGFNDSQLLLLLGLVPLGVQLPVPDDALDDDAGGQTALTVYHTKLPLLLWSLDEGRDSNEKLVVSPVLAPQ